MTDESIDSWLRDLERAGSAAVFRDVAKVVKKAAVNVKRDWRANARASAPKHARAYPYSITFDEPRHQGGTVESLVGPEKNKRQGDLGNLLEFGSAHNPPHWDGKRAAEKEAPNFERYLGDLGVDVLSTDYFGG